MEWHFTYLLVVHAFHSFVTSFKVWIHTWIQKTPQSPIKYSLLRLVNFHHQHHQMLNTWRTLQERRQINPKVHQTKTMIVTYWKCYLWNTPAYLFIKEVGSQAAFFSNNFFFVDTITLLAKEKAKWFEQIFANLCGSRWHKQTVQMSH